MRVLAIDTALEACSAAVLDTERAAIALHESLPMLRGHAEALMPLIARVLDAPARVRRARPHRRDHRPRQLHRLARRHRRGARHCACGRQAGGRPLDARRFRRALIAADDTLPVVAAIDARHDHVYLQVFGPGGRTIVAPRDCAVA